MNRVLALACPHTYAHIDMVGPWGDAIRRLRDARDMTQQRLARLAKISPTTLGLIEKGGHTQTQKLERVAEALGVDLAAVLVSPQRLLEHEERIAMANEIAEVVIRTFEDKRRAAEPVEIIQGVRLSMDGARPMTHFRDNKYDGPDERKTNIGPPAGTPERRRVANFE